jgi:glycosyltransferase involved in cell wall biosynthesis
MEYTLKINVFTERPGWITNRLAEELVLNSEYAKLYYGLKMKRKIWHSGVFHQNIEKLIINYYLPYYLAPILKQKSVLTISCLTHYQPDNLLKKRGWDNALLNSDFFVAISKLAYDQALSHGVDKSKIRIIKYGPSKIYKPTFNVLIVGAPGVRKGEDFLKEVIDACVIDSSIVWKSASETGWGLETICKDGSDLRNAYDWADLLFVPSLLEGAHTGTIEAIFSGVPVLTRDTGWAKFELKNYVATVSKSNEAKDYILSAANKKNYFVKSNILALEKAGFSYTSWRNEHFALFNELIN